MFFPQQNVLAVGDAVSGQGWPVVDWQTGGWIGGIVGGLQRLQTLANEETRIVPARGPVLGLADLKAQSEMYGTIYDRLAQLLNKGRGPSEAVAAQPTKEFDAQMGNPDEFVRRAFESLWAYLVSGCVDENAESEFRMQTMRPNLDQMRFVHSAFGIRALGVRVLPWPACSSSAR